MSQTSDTAIDASLGSHAHFVRELARRLLDDPGTADDVAQEALIRAWRSPPSALATMRVWLRTVARRLASRTRREASRRTRREHAAAVAEATAAGGDDAARSEVLHAIADVVGALPQPLRDVVWLRYYEGLPPRRVAARLGLSVAAFESRLRRAHDELRQGLQRRLGPRDWRLGLLALAAPGAPVPLGVVLGGVVVVKWMLAAAVLAVVALWFWVLAPTAATAPGGSATVAGAPDPAATAAAGAAPGEAPPLREAVAGERGAAAVVPTWRVTGRVLDERRRPVAGARVELARGDRAVVAAASGSDGGYAFELPAGEGERIGAGLSASDAGGAVASVVLVHELADGRECVAQDLVLRAGARLRVLVGAAARVVARPVFLGFGLHRHDRRTDATGAAELGPLVPGRWCVDALADDGRRASAIADLVAGPGQELQLDLDGSATLELTLVEHATGRPLAGVRVELTEQLATEGGGMQLVDVTGIAPPAVSDADGRCRVAGLRLGQNLWVNVAGHRPAATATAPHEVAATFDRWRLELEPAATEVLRWRLVPGEVEPPADGTACPLRNLRGQGWTLPAAARVVEGHLVVADVELPAGAAFLAAASDRRLALLTVPPAGKQRVASFQRERCVEVELGTERGAGIAGWPVVFREPNGGTVLGVRRTDGAGHARLDGLLGGKVELWIDREPWSLAHGERAVAVADLAAGDARVTIQRRAPILVAAEVYVDGERRLPPELKLHAEGGWCEAVQEDPERGALRFELWPDAGDAARRVLLYGPWDHSIAIAEVAAARGEAQIALRLDRLQTVTLELLPPADGTFRVHLEREMAGQWFVHGHAIDQPARATVTTRFSNVPAGRYRARDEASGVLGTPVELVRGAASTRVLLDLGRVVTLAGRVVAAPGVEPGGAKVELRGAAGNVLRSAACAKDGSFTLRASVGDAGLVLVARLGAEVSEPIAVTGALRDVILPLSPR